MATTSEVKAGLDAVSAQIAASRTRLKGFVDGITGTAAALTNIPTTFSDLIATIDGYETPGPPDGAFEELSVDELARLTAEFVPLRNEANALAAQAAAYTEF